MKKNKKSITPDEKNTEEIISSANTELPQPTEHVSTSARMTGSDGLNPQPSTKNMEVHHHGHVHETKKWKEYIFQFLMLFLAVFCGFLAEYQLEHKIERDRVKEFSKSLVQDLQNDTAAINTHKKTAELYIAVADSLLSLSNSPLEGQHATAFSFYTRFAYWTVPISWSRNTFEQIKNSGSLRYFKNDRLLNKILEYDAIVNDINSEAEANKIRGNMLLTYTNAVIEPELNYELSKYLLTSLDTMSVETRERFFSYKTASLENKREKITVMLNMVIVQQRNLRFQINDGWQRAHVLATELMNDIKKEYHLK